MKVLIAHNRYRSATPSGENEVVDSEIAALQAAGVDVTAYLRSSDEIDSMSASRRLTVPLRPLVSLDSMADVRRLILSHRIDVVHLHNPFPLISPAVIRTANRLGVPVVQTVHNHRHACVKGTHFRDGKVCRECVGKVLPTPALVHGCYQDSRVKSVPMVTAQVLHRSTWRLVHRFLALTPQLRDHLVTCGIEPQRIQIRPNTVADPGTGAAVPSGQGLLYVGRLSEEKGVRLLLDAWAELPVGLSHLTVVGSGPLEGLVAAAAAARGDITVRGSLPRDEVSAAMRAAAVVVVPSTCPEAFPRVVVEAFAQGRPVLATALGGLPGIVVEGTGLVVQPDTASYAAGLRQALQLPHDTGARARARYERVYHPDIVLRQLLDTYASAAAEQPRSPQDGATAAGRAASGGSR